MNNTFNIWWLPIVLYIFFGNIYVRILQKRISGMHSRVKRLFIQYFFCVTLAAGLFLLSGCQFHMAMWLIAVIGCANGYACYLHWKAIDISLSKTSVFTFADDIIAMTLSYFILKEGRLITGWAGLGILTCLICTTGFAMHSYERRRSFAIYRYVGIYSVIWGIAIFSERFFAFEKMPIASFLAAWYLGAFIAACFMLAFYKDKDLSQKTSTSLKSADYFWLFGLSVGIVGQMVLGYWAYTLNPQIVVQPIFLVAEAVLPTILGLTLFCEGKHFDKEEWLYTVIGLLGIVEIAVSYR